MSKLTKTLARGKYKIVPTYNKEFKQNGYVVLKKQLLGWLPMTMLMHDEDGDPYDAHNYFPDYNSAYEFLKRQTTIIQETDDEEIFAEKGV